MYANELLLPRGEEDPLDESLILSSVEDSAGNCLLQNRPMQALEFVAQALEIRRRMSPDRLTANTLAYLQASVKAVSSVAMGLLESGDLLTSQQVLSRLDSILRSLPLAAVAVERCAVLNNLACVFRKAGQLALAKKGLMKALRLCDKFKELPLDRAGTYLNMCAVLSNLGRHGPALEFGRKAVQFAQEDLIARNALDSSEEATHLVKVLAVAYFNVAAEYEHLTAYASALEWYRKAAGVIEHSANEALMGMLEGLNKACRVMSRKIAVSHAKSRPQSARRGQTPSDTSSSRPISAMRPNSSRRDSRKVSSRPSSSKPVPPPSSSRRAPRSTTPLGEEPIATKSGKRLLTCINWADSAPEDQGTDIESLTQLGVMDFRTEEKPPRPRIRVRGSKRRPGDQRTVSSRPESAGIWGSLTPEPTANDDGSMRLADLEEVAVKPVAERQPPKEPKCRNLLTRFESPPLMELVLPAKSEPKTETPTLPVLIESPVATAVDIDKPDEFGPMRTVDEVRSSTSSRAVAQDSSPPIAAEVELPRPEVPPDPIPPAPLSKQVTELINTSATKLQAYIKGRLARRKFRAMLVASHRRAERQLVLRTGKRFANGEYGVISVYETPQKFVLVFAHGNTYECDTAKAGNTAQELLAAVEFDGQRLFILEKESFQLVEEPMPLKQVTPDVEAKIRRFQALVRGRIARRLYQLLNLKAARSLSRELVYRSGRKLNASTFGVVSIYRLSPDAVEVVLQPATSAKEFQCVVPYIDSDYAELAERVKYNGVSVKVVAPQRQVIPLSPAKPQATYGETPEAMETSGIDHGVRVLRQEEKELGGFKYLLTVCTYEGTRQLSIEAEGVSMNAPKLRELRVGEEQVAARFNLSRGTDLTAVSSALIAAVVVLKSNLALPVD